MQGQEEPFGDINIRAVQVVNQIIDQILKQPIVPTILYSTTQSFKANLIESEFETKHDLSHIWRRKSSFSANFVLNDKLIFKAGKVLEVDFVVTCYTKLSMHGIEENVDFYLYDIRSGKTHHVRKVNSAHYRLSDKTVEDFVTFIDNKTLWGK